MYVLYFDRMQLQLSEQRNNNYVSRTAELEARVAQLEAESEEARKEKRDLLSKLQKKEAELDSVHIKVISDLKTQLKKEKQKVEKVLTLKRTGNLCNRDLSSPLPPLRSKTASRRPSRRGGSPTDN